MDTADSSGTDYFERSTDTEQNRTNMTGISSYIVCFFCFVR